MHYVIVLVCSNVAAVILALCGFLWAIRAEARAARAERQVADHMRAVQLLAQPFDPDGDDGGGNTLTVVRGGAEVIPLHRRRSFRRTAVAAVAVTAAAGVLAWLWPSGRTVPPPTALPVPDAPAVPRPPSSPTPEPATNDAEPAEMVVDEVAVIITPAFVPAQATPPAPPSSLLPSATASASHTPPAPTSAEQTTTAPAIPTRTGCAMELRVPPLISTCLGG